MKWISKEVYLDDLNIDPDQPLDPPSEELKQCIRDGKIESLYGLLEDNWEEEMRKLIDDYLEKSCRKR